MFHQQYDLIMAPTLCGEPLPVGLLSRLEGQDYAECLSGFVGDTAVFNQTGQPSLSLPVCWSARGLPLGIQFSAGYGQDALLLRLA